MKVPRTLPDAEIALTRGLARVSPVGVALAVGGAILVGVGVGAPALKWGSSQSYDSWRVALVVLGTVALVVGISAQERWTLLRRHGWVGGVLLGAGSLAFGHLMMLRPYTVDNLQSLSTWTPGAWELLISSSSNLPVYRPVTTLSLWLQHLVIGINPPLHELTNLLLWVTCSGLVYVVLLRLTKARVVAAAVALLFLLDFRGNAMVEVIGDRATTLALGLGLTAFLVAITPIARARYRWHLAALGALLLLSSLAKEYGLAFSGAVILAALLSRPEGWKAIVGVATGVIAVRLGLHLLIVGGTEAGYCETMGYFREARNSCFGEVSGEYLDQGYLLLTDEARLRQHLWNVGATLVGTVWPSRFNPEGVYQWPNVGLFNRGQTGGPAEVLIGTTLLALSAVALVKRPRVTLPFLALIVVNALLSLALYRTRNQIIGMTGLYVAAGIGAQVVAVSVRARWRTVAAVCAAVAFIALVAIQGNYRVDQSAAFLHRYSDYAAEGNLCGRVREVDGNYFVDLKAVQEIRHWYGFYDPDCERGVGTSAKPERLDASGDPVGPG